MTLTAEQRKTYLQRHLSNALFAKLARGDWHHVPITESPKFRVYGAGTAPPIPGDATHYAHRWLATVSPSVPRLLMPMHALFIDDAIYQEVLGDFAEGTLEVWFELLASGTERLYHLEDYSMRRNRTVPPLLCAVALALVLRLQEMRLVVPIASRSALDDLEPHDQQVVRAALNVR